MKSNLQRLREAAFAPRPARVTPGDPIHCDGIGDGRIAAVTAGTCWIHFEKMSTDATQYSYASTSTAAHIPDLEWIDGKWRIDSEKLGAAGEGPGVERFHGALKPGQ